MANEQGIVLKAANGLFVSAEFGGGIDPRNNPGAVALTASRTVAGPFEQFAVVRNDDGSVSLRTSVGTLLTAEGSGGSFLRTDAAQIGPWERFELVTVDKGIAIRCADRLHWLCAEVFSPRKELNATRTAIGPWETFAIDGLAPPVAILPRLVPTGQVFALETGKRWTAIECSDFNLLARFLANEDIEPVLTQRADCGFNLLRVWTLFDVAGIGHLIPSEQPNFYDRLQAFIGKCAAHGLYCELTVFTGAKRLLPARAAQQAHLDGVVGAVRNYGGGALIEAGNEFEQGDNQWLLDLQWPSDVVISGGSVGSEKWPSDFASDGNAHASLPLLRYQEFHTNGASEWWRKVGHNAMEVADANHRPVIANENTRFPDQDQSVDHAHDAAAGGALLCAGSCFHSVRGKTSELWDGAELNCAKAWAAGASSVPLEFQAGAYEHHEELEPAGNLLRVYARLLSAGQRFFVKIRQ